MPVLDGKKYPYTKEGMRRYVIAKKKKEKSKSFTQRTKEGFKKGKIEKKDGRNMNLSDFTNSELRKKKLDGLSKSLDEQTLYEWADSHDASKELKRREKKAKKVYTDAPMRNATNKKRAKKDEHEQGKAFVDKMIRKYRKKKDKEDKSPKYPPSKYK